MSEPTSTSADQQPQASALLQVQEAARKTRGAMNESFHYVARTFLQSVTLAELYIRQGYDAAVDSLDHAKVYYDAGLAQYKAVEDEVFTTLKLGVELAVTNPYISYPAATAGVLLAFPLTRRLLYQATLGRFRSPEVVVKSSEAKIQSLKTKTEEFLQDTKKLEARMQAAEEEYTRGLSKLRSTRQELQRLSSQIYKFHQTAAGTLDQLRMLGNIEGVAALRGEAATQASLLRSQRARIEKYIYNIAKKDI